MKILFLCVITFLFFAFWQKTEIAFGQKLSIRQPKDDYVTYYRGDHLSLNQTIRLKQDGTIQQIFQNDTNGILVKTGNYITTKNFISYKTEKILFQKNIRSSTLPIDGAFVLVTWGQRHYLIDLSEAFNFCNGVNSGEEPRVDTMNNYFLRDGDESKPVVGLPTIPLPWQAYILKRPVSCHVISLRRLWQRKKRQNGLPSSRVIVVRLDAGLQNQLKSGMRMFIRTSPVFRSKYFRYVQEVIIQKVNKKYCFAQFSLVEKEIPISVGALATTREYSNE